MTQTVAGLDRSHDGGQTSAAAAPATKRRAHPASRMRRIGPAPVLTFTLSLCAWFSAGFLLERWVGEPLPFGHDVLLIVTGPLVSLTLAMAAWRQQSSALSAAAAAAAKAERNMIRAAADLHPDGLALWSKDDNLILWNRQFEKIMPLAASELKFGLSYERLLEIWLEHGYCPPGAGHDWVRDCLERRWMGQGRMQRRITERDYLISDFCDAESRTLTVFADVTELRTRENALKESEERYGLAMVAANEALWDLDLRSDRFFLARRALALVGAERKGGAISRDDWLAHIHPDDAAAQRHAWDDHLHGDAEVYRVEYRICASDGSVRWVHDRGVALRDSTGNPYRIAGSVGDITDRKKAEADLLAARDAAERANRARSEFLSSISHELKTPLNAVIGFSGILADQEFGPLGAPEYVEFAREVQQAGRRLDRLTSDLLDVAKAGSSSHDLAESTIDLRQSIARIVDLMGDTAMQRRMSVVQDLPDDLPSLIADERKLKHLLFNLLGGLVERAGEGGSLKIGAKRAADGGLVLEISSSGPRGQDDERPDGESIHSFVSDKAAAFLTAHGGALDVSIDPEGENLIALNFPAERTA